MIPMRTKGTAAVLSKNDIIELKITALSSEGNGIGHSQDGMTVFTPLTAIGDTALVRIVKVKKNYAFGRLEKVINPSSIRTVDNCAAFRQCGGCVLRHIDYQSELEAKTLRVYDAIKRIGGIDMPPQPILSGPDERYRNKAQYPISQTYETGFFATHSHRIIPCDDCLLQPEIFEKISKTVMLWARLNKISIYNEATNKGLLRHLYLRIGQKTDEILVVLVINGEHLPHSESLIKSLLELLGERLKSLQININRADTNVILGEKCAVLYGSDYINDILCGVRVRISPLSFYQVNRNMAEKIYKMAAEYAAPHGKKILDLYCGAGTIGLSMASEAQSIIGVEIVPQAIEDAKFNAKQNGIKNARFICADAAEAAIKLKLEGIAPDTVILDPPRKGCSEELLETVCNGFAPERIVYVSCDPATLARDIAYLSTHGYTLNEYTPADLFPRTAHCECVALLERHSDINS